ncbi:hypothetical protein Misp02_60110 [Microtetraspora sp. NBRC 16547]|nr:hypothetical protein Misp02_60110 [Microtetraspora sp. NBRC 16547]
MRRARRLTRAQLAVWGLRDQRDVAELVVSELVTNALRHAGGPTRLSLYLLDGTLRCEVEDAYAMPPPTTRHPGHAMSETGARDGIRDSEDSASGDSASGDRASGGHASDDGGAVAAAIDCASCTDSEDDHGRGLHLIERLACCWGCVRTATGKAVWVELPPPGPIRHTYSHARDMRHA